MTHEEEMLYFKMQMLQAEIAMNGMIAENAKRESDGHAQAYSENDFRALVDTYGIHHNAFPYQKGE